jgi:predicted nucleotidyltransferase
VIHFLQQSSPKMNHPLLSLLLPEYRLQVLALLLLHPEEALHGREVARRTGLSPGTVTRELVRLAEAGLLRRQQRGNQQVYSAQTQCLIYPELASLLRKTTGVAQALRLALQPVAEQVRVAFVFGSVAQGRETAGSDVDVMLIGTPSFIQVVELLYPVQLELGREINPKIFTPDEWVALRAQDEPFIRDVLAKPQLFLIGTADDLAQLAR